MRKYKIVINGRSYEVEVEEIKGSPRASKPVVTQPSSQPLEPKRAPAGKQATPAPKPESKDKIQGLITSPLPGVVIKVMAEPGKCFSRGQPLLTVEAMKMENEILAPCNCVVEQVFTAPTRAVRTGDSLLKITPS